VVEVVVLWLLIVAIVEVKIFLYGVVALGREPKAEEDAAAEELLLVALVGERPK
jgi:hypothetical protein